MVEVERAVLNPATRVLRSHAAVQALDRGLVLGGHDDFALSLLGVLG